jgi:hypothetical protein
MWKFNLEEEKIKHPKIWNEIEYLPNGKKASNRDRICWFRQLVMPCLLSIKHRASFYASWEDIGKARYNAR